VNRDYLPPLLRGIGTSVILIGSVVALVAARRDVDRYRSRGQAVPLASAFGDGSQLTLALVAKELQELRAEALNDNIVEQVIESRWFEWLGLIGVGVVSGSFYIESLIGRAKSPSDTK
jgi:hypothetical protein